VITERSRRRSSATDHVADEGPFVSFTDLFIGILFLFLILVAALMLMHQEAVQRDKVEAQIDSQRVAQLAEQIRQIQAKLDTRAKLDAAHPPFRLAIVFNVYQAPAGAQTNWTFSRTVQLYRAANGLCLENVILRGNLSLAWKPPVDADIIPTAENQSYVRMGTPCTLSASGENWDIESETGGVKRASPTLYSGATVLHKKSGKEEQVQLQYRILRIYDNYFR
jgi:hypothetical protein